MKDSKNNIAKKTLMSEAEIQDMQRKIDEGIVLAQQRLIARAVHNQTTLVVAQGDKVIEIKADELLAQVQQPVQS